MFLVTPKLRCDDGSGLLTHTFAWYLITDYDYSCWHWSCLKRLVARYKFVYPRGRHTTTMWYIEFRKNVLHNEVLIVWYHLLPS